MATSAGQAAIWKHFTPVEGKPDLASCNSCRRYYAFNIFSRQLPENLTQRAGKRNGGREGEVKYYLTSQQEISFL